MVHFTTMSKVQLWAQSLPRLTLISTWVIQSPGSLAEGVSSVCLPRILSWHKYIVLVFWTGSEEQAMDFVQRLTPNSYNLKFTCDCHPKRVMFVDLTIRLDNNSLLCAESLFWDIPTGHYLRAVRTTRNNWISSRKHRICLGDF